MKPLAWMLAGCVASAAIAYAVGAHRSSPATATTSAASTAPRVVTERILAPASSAGLSREDLRAVIREELDARAQAGAAAAEPASREENQRMVTAAHAVISDGLRAEPASREENQRMVTAAHAVISDGLRDGVWDLRDRVALRERIAHLGPDDAQDAIAPLFAAINAQRVQLDGPPL